jgi:hypothetical protein
MRKSDCTSGLNRNLYLVIASEARVPNERHRIVVITATIKEFFNADWKTGLSKTSIYQRSEKPRIGKLTAGVELKENKMMIPTGKKRYMMTRIE